jgi:excisionase family DNA binding protein
MTPSEAARVLGVSADTVRAMSDDGRLPTMRTSGGIRLFYERDVQKLAEARSRARAKPR